MNFHSTKFLIKKKNHDLLIGLNISLKTLRHGDRKSKQTWILYLDTIDYLPGLFSIFFQYAEIILKFQNLFLKLINACLQAFTCWIRYFRCIWYWSWCKKQANAQNHYDQRRSFMFHKERINGRWSNSDLNGLGL